MTDIVIFKDCIQAIAVLAGRGVITPEQAVEATEKAEELFIPVQCRVKA